MSELGEFLELEPELEEVSGERLGVLDSGLELTNLFLFHVWNAWLFQKFIQVVWPHKWKFLGGKLLTILQFFELLLPLFLAHKLRWHRVWEHHQPHWKNQLSAWNDDEKWKRNEFVQILLDLS